MYLTFFILMFFKCTFQKVAVRKIGMFLSFPLSALFLCAEWSFCLVATEHHDVDLLAVQWPHAGAGGDREIIYWLVLLNGFSLLCSCCSRRPSGKGRGSLLWEGLSGGSCQTNTHVKHLVYFNFSFYEWGNWGLFLFKKKKYLCYLHY